jgi:hypothetical protein
MNSPYHRYCHEFANVLDNTLRAPGLADVLTVSYIPTPYPVYPNGTLQCEDTTQSPPFNFDCRGAKWEACVVTSTSCGPPPALSSPPSAPGSAQAPASCDKRSQRKLASFFKCFEGPFANHDGPTDFTKARPCAQRAGLDVGAIASCFDSIENVTTVNNAVQKPFWDASQAVLAVGFPYVKINDQAQSANWPDLLSIVCDLQTAAAAAEARIPRGCEVDGAAGRRMTVELRGPGVDIAVFSAAAYAVALTQATNFIISNVRPMC